MASKNKPARKRKAAKPKWRYAADMGDGWLRVMPPGMGRADALDAARSCGKLVQVKVEVRR